MRRLDDTIALVTGGSRGIGRALSIQLAEAGATVYTCARDADALGETREAAGSEADLIAETADVTDAEQIQSLIDRIRDERGRLDVLINNAGILGPRCSLEETPLEGWRQTLAVNLDGVFIATRASLPLLRESDEPLVLNVSSSVGREGRGGWSAYSVSKCGVEGMTEILADEFDAGCVASINPGGTATEMRAEAYPDEDPETLPTAETVVLLTRTLGPEQSGRKYDSRDLFEWIDRPEPPSGMDLPTASDA